MEWIEALREWVPEQYHALLFFAGAGLFVFSASVIAVKIILESIKTWYEIKLMKRKEQEELRRKKREEAKRRHEELRLRMEEERRKADEAGQPFIGGMKGFIDDIGQVPPQSPGERFAIRAGLFSVWALPFIPDSLLKILIYIAISGMTMLFLFPSIAR